MPHGDTSDYVGLSLFFTGIASIFFPVIWSTDVGPIKAFFDSPLDGNAVIMASFVGSVLIFLGWLFYVVRWNTINGKFANGPGCIIAAANCIYISYAMDGAFVFRAWHVLAGVFLVGAYHMFFNANAVWTSESLKKHEQEKKAKANKSK
jgi:hypothetical protein